jgi:hypothetical protein
MEEGQSTAAIADPDSRKRMREDRERSHPDEDKVDELLIAALLTISQTMLSDLRKTLARPQCV